MWDHPKSTHYALSYEFGHISLTDPSHQLDFYLFSNVINGHTHKLGFSSSLLQQAYKFYPPFGKRPLDAVFGKLLMLKSRYIGKHMTFIAPSNIFDRILFKVGYQYPCLKIFRDLENLCTKISIHALIYLTKQVFCLTSLNTSQQRNR